MVTNTPIESGNTQDNVIEYVRCQMYEHLVKNKNLNLNEELDINSEAEENIDKSDNDISDLDDSDNDSDGVLKDYLFTLYLAFIMWGAFAEIEDQLSLFLTDETGKSKVDANRV